MKLAVVDLEMLSSFFTIPVGKIKPSQGLHVHMISPGKCSLVATTS